MGDCRGQFREALGIDDGDGSRPKLPNPGTTGGRAKFRWETLFAQLAGEPWNLKPWEVRKLTWPQIIGIYGHPRDDKGQLITESEAEPHSWTPFEICQWKWKSRGLSEAQIRVKFSEETAENAFVRQLQGEQVNPESDVWRTRIADFRMGLIRNRGKACL